LGLAVDPQTCKNVTVLPNAAGFAPRYWKDVIPLLKKRREDAGPKVIERLKNAYAIHLQGFNVNTRRFLLKKNDVITRTLLDACPVITKIAGDEL
jgi:hypothetical protein